MNRQGPEFFDNRYSVHRLVISFPAASMPSDSATTSMLTSAAHHVRPSPGHTLGRVPGGMTHVLANCSENELVRNKFGLGCPGSLLGQLVRLQVAVFKELKGVSYEDGACFGGSRKAHG